MEGAKHAMCATHDAALRETCARSGGAEGVRGHPRPLGTRGRRARALGQDRCGAAWSRRGSARLRASPRRRPTKRENDAATSGVAAERIAAASPRRLRKRAGNENAKPAGGRETPRRLSSRDARCTADVVPRSDLQSWRASSGPHHGACPRRRLALGKARSGSVPPSPAREAEKNDPSFSGGAGEAPENEWNESSAPRARPAGLFARLDKWVRKKMAPRK